MTEPTLHQIELHENGDIQIVWQRPGDTSDSESTFHTSLISREALEGDEDLAYWTKELLGDSHEFLMAWLKTKNRAASLAGTQGQHQ